MQRLSPYTTWIHVFTYGDFERTVSLAHTMGLQVGLGAWLTHDLSANEQEIASLINAARAGRANMAIVGNEVLSRGYLWEDQLTRYINRVREEVPGIPVATAEVADVFLSHPSIISNIDVVLVNFFPHGEGIPVEHAIDAIRSWYPQVVAAAGGKPVIVSETGWPSCGNPVGEALPSPENAARYFLNFASWARVNHVPYFYFEAFDERWRTAYEGTQGACWGIWDEDGNLKPGMERVLNGDSSQITGPIPRFPSDVQGK